MAPRGGGPPHEKVGDVRLTFSIKHLVETNVRLARGLLDPYTI